MVQKLLHLINRAGYHLQQAEQAQQHGLAQVESYNLKKYEREITKIRAIKQLLEV